MNEFFKSNHFGKLLAVLAGVLVLVFVFAAGVFVGQVKTRFAYRWGENYYRNIMGPGRRGMMDFERRGFGGHSGLGQILKIEENSLVVKDLFNVEKAIAVTDQTQIIKNFQAIKLSGLKLDDRVIVIGRPNSQGQIEARLIRVIPD